MKLLSHYCLDIPLKHSKTLPSADSSRCSTKQASSRKAVSTKMEDLRRFTSSSFPKAPTFKAAWLGISNHSSNQHLVAMAATQPPQSLSGLKVLKCLKRQSNCKAKRIKPRLQGWNLVAVILQKKWCLEESYLCLKWFHCRRPQAAPLTELRILWRCLACCIIWAHDYSCDMHPSKEIQCLLPALDINLQKQLHHWLYSNYNIL